MTPRKEKVFVRNTRKEDFPQIIELSRKVYQDSTPWSELQLASHLDVFPEGQFVAVERETGKLVGMSASLIILWDDYDTQASWRDFTDRGMFTNHDPQHGRTLYGAEVMVSPGKQRMGIGKKIYKSRRELVEELGLLRIRAGARLRNYHRYAGKYSAEEYVKKIVTGEIGDPTLSFQLKQGFEVLAVVSDYLHNDAESLGKAALIEWVNKKVATNEDYIQRKNDFSLI